jgi:poly-gamma-glutamate capsule biosynthesis protein CapA/YwtB (metallophosphatase superfamily)
VSTTIALTGNTFFTQGIAQLRDERFQKAIALLRSADVTITNLECTIPDSDSWPAFAAGQGWAARYLAGTESMVRDLKAIGIDAVWAANNHVSDFGEPGMVATVRALRQEGMPFAGIGESLTEASAPCYLDTSSGHRVAIIAACDWGPRGAQGLNFPWPVGNLASDEAPPFRSRPGMNLLRYDVVTQVTREQLEQLRAMSAALGWDQDKVLRRNGYEVSHPLVGMTTNLGLEVDTETEVYFLGRKFVVADEPGQRTVPCQDDLDRIYRQVAEARRQADIVCFALHDQSHGTEVHDYINVVAHGAIDAGADIFANTGGTPMGIELYKGKAIMYGLPTFFLQMDGIPYIPSTQMALFGLPSNSTAADFLDVRTARVARALQETGGRSHVRFGVGGTAVHTCAFDDNARLTEIRIQPLYSLGGSPNVADGMSVPRFRRGLPMMPDSALADRVVENMMQLSKRFGTEVEAIDGRGRIRCPRAAAGQPVDPGWSGRWGQRLPSSS